VNGFFGFRLLGDKPSKLLKSNALSTPMPENSLAVPMPTDFYAKTPMKIAGGIFAKAQCVKFSRIAREIHAANRLGRASTPPPERRIYPAAIRAGCTLAG